MTFAKLFLSFFGVEYTPSKKNKKKLDVKSDYVKSCQPGSKVCHTHIKNHVFKIIEKWLYLRWLMIDRLQKSWILRFSKLECLIFHTYDIVSDVVEILVQWGVRILPANCTFTSTTSETVLCMLLSHKLEKRQINKNACCFLLPCQILYYIHITQRKCIGIGP